MRAERLASMSRAVAFDTETYLIMPGYLAPPLVCGSAAVLINGRPDGRLLDKTQARDLFSGWLASDLVIIGANIAYDMLVMAVDAARRGVDLMPQIFKAYDEDRVFDVQIAEQLHAIANGQLGIDPRSGERLPGRYSLETCVDIVLDRKNAKENDEYRLRYGELDDVPIAQWPEPAQIYPVDDACNTLETGLAQAGIVPRRAKHAWIQTALGAQCARCHAVPGIESRTCPDTSPNRNLHDLARQVYAAWALHLGAAWGIRTDPVMTEILAAAAQAGRDAALPEAVKAGYLRPDGTENQAHVRERVALAYGVDPFSECAECRGARRVPSVGTKNPKATKTCPRCNGTGLDLESAPVPRSAPSGKFPNGQVQVGRDILIESGDESLMAYGAAQEDDKILDTYVPFLRKGFDAPINLRPHVLLDTGRVSYSGEIQLLPRFVSAHLAIELKARGGPVGVRDCIVPRPRHVFFSNDFKGGELVTFAESACERVGFSRMGEALNRGVDVHSALAATALGVTYERFLEMLAGKHGAAPKKLAKLYRQAMKPENFGNPGGMGAARKVIQNRKQGPDTPHPSGPSMVDDGSGELVPGYKGLRFCILTGGAERCGERKITEWKGRPYPPLCLLCVEAAERGRDAWFKQWPEARPYLDWHSNNAESVGEVVQLYSKRIRGGCEYASEANGDFQALLADIAKRSLCRVVKEQYTDRSSVLYGSRTIAFLHDELFGEAREDVAAEVSERVNVIMVEEFQRGCPRHKAACAAEPTIMPRWYKAAEPVRDGNGRLIPWVPKAA